MIPMNEIEMIQKLSVRNAALEQQLEQARMLVILYASHSPLKHRFTKAEIQAAAQVESIEYNQLRDGTITLKVHKAKGKK